MYRYATPHTEVLIAGIINYTRDVCDPTRKNQKKNCAKCTYNKKTEYHQRRSWTIGRSLDRGQMTLAGYNQLKKRLIPKYLPLFFPPAVTKLQNAIISNSRKHYIFLRMCCTTSSAVKLMKFRCAYYCPTVFIYFPPPPQRSAIRILWTKLPVIYR